MTPAEGTVYLVCTSAGEVGLNASGDDLVSDLSTFDSMAQRFGRVNRFGDREDTRIDIVYPADFDKSKFDARRQKTLDLLMQLQGDGSPAALERLDPEACRNAFAPPPDTLPTTDILFDAWALTTIREKLPGRPLVEPYLHGVSAWDPPETQVAWREEVEILTEDLRALYDPEELLEDYPLKPHELLRDNSGRVFDRLKKLRAPKETPVWILAEDGMAEPTTLAKLVDAGRPGIERKTVLLPPAAGGLQNGLLGDHPAPADDVADQWFEDAAKQDQRRRRLWSDEPKPAAVLGMRLAREIDTRPDADEQGTDDEGEGGNETDRPSRKGRYWRWYVRPQSADDDGSKTSMAPVTWEDHTNQVTGNAEHLAGALLSDRDDLAKALVLAARCHDLGKRREVWQRSIGNPRPKEWYAKSGRDPLTGKLWRPLELTRYRHEFGSLVDTLHESQREFADFRRLPAEVQDLVLHLIAVHHGYGRPHFPEDRAFDPEAKGQQAEEIAAAVMQRFARLQRRFGRWGLAYLESLLRAADYAASAGQPILGEAPS